MSHAVPPLRTNGYDAQSGNPSFILEVDFSFERCDRPGETVTFPAGKDTDGGSIPGFLQSFARPLDRWGIADYLKHDLEYTMQGGRREYADAPEATASLTRNTITRARADRDLATGIFGAQKMLLEAQRSSDIAWAWLQRFAVSRVTLTVIADASFALGVAWAFLRTTLIYAAVRAFGWKAWNSIEPGTQPTHAK